MKAKLLFKFVYLLFLFLYCENANAQSPDWLWGKSVGGITFDQSISLAIDTARDGAVYSTGNFYGTVDFDPGVGTTYLTAAGEEDVFISKLDDSGNLIWARALGGKGEDVGYSIAVDPSGSGDVYITGNFSDTADFDPGNGIFNLIPNYANQFFILKLDSSGNFEWAKTLGIYSSLSCIHLDASENIYITGQFSWIVDFDPGPDTTTITSAGQHDIFISKYDSSCNLKWAKAMGPSNNAIGLSITTDVSGNVYTTGYFQSTVDFDPGPGTVSIFSGGGAGFISKLDSSGNYVWAKAMVGTGVFSWSITLDASYNVYTTGYFTDTVDFDPGTGVANLISDGPYSDIFISKLDSAGNYIWAKRIGGPNDDDETFSIALDSYGNIYTTGYFFGFVDFDPGAATFILTPTSIYNSFISILDSAGNFVWAKAINGVNGYVIGKSVVIDAFNNAYATGFFTCTSVSLGSTTLTNEDNTGSTSDIFIVKLDRLTAGIPSVVNTFGFSVSPNPATDHLSIDLAANQGNSEITIIDITGKVILKNTFSGKQNTQVDVRGFSEGIYFIRIQSSDFLSTKKFIVVK